MTDSFQHPKCYMKSMNDCSSKITGEHYISAGILKEFTSVKVRGFAWAKDWKEMSVDALQSNILCSTHNNNLSPLDDEMLKIFRGIKDITDQTVPNYKNRLFRADGSVMELWMLKTLCGLIASKNRRKDSGDRIEFTVPDHWIAILTGKIPFPDGCGMFLDASVGDKLDMGDTIGVAPITLTDSDVIFGCRLDFRGWPFVLIIDKPEKIPSNLLLRPAEIKIHTFSKSKIKITYND